MNASSTRADSVDLSLQSEAIALRPQGTICPKCQHQRTSADQGPDWQCPGCGIAYNKAMAQAEAVARQANAAARQADAVARQPDAGARKVNTTPITRARQEIERDEPETATPGVVSLSLQGRIGRLRYLAFSWPIAALSGVGMAAAVLGPHKQSPNIPLIVLVGVLWFWLSLRLMALRLHDLNCSAKWLLALLIVPALGGALGGGPKIVALGGGLFWVAALLLVVLPGSEGDNDYGPPPDANTTWVKVGAALLLALIALGVVSNIKYMRYMHAQKPAIKTGS